MRFIVVVCLCLAGPVWADKKIVDMTPGFERELAACEMQQGGIAILLGKARAYVPPATEKAELDADIEKLAKGQAVIAAYCTEVKGMVALLKDNAATAYKKVEKDIDARDNTVRKARREGKTAVEDLAPITRKLIPKVNARITQIEERKPTAKFPSGRVVELPKVTGGAWKLGGNLVTDIAELAGAGATGTVTSRPFTSATCDQQQKQFAKGARDEPIAELELSAAAKAIDVRWSWRYVRRDRTPHLLTMMCVPVGTGGFVALADMTPADRLATADEMTKLMVAMLAVQLPKPAN